MFSRRFIYFLIILFIALVMLFRHTSLLRSTAAAGTGGGLFSSMFSSSQQQQKQSTAVKPILFNNIEDPYNIGARFIHHQQRHFAQALYEIERGSKTGCWSWFFFVSAPYVLNGQELGSPMNKFYALRDLPPNTHQGFDAARAFLKFPTTNGVNLRENYYSMMLAVAEKLEEGIPPEILVGVLDVNKLRSSLKLMRAVTENGEDDEIYQVCCRCIKIMGEEDQVYY